MSASVGSDTERRAHLRREVALPVAVGRVGGRPLLGRGTTVDVSEGGARLAGPSGFSVGDVVVVTIDAPSGDLSVSNQGLVVGVSPDLHVAFRSMEDDAAVDLRRVLDLGGS